MLYETSFVEIKNNILKNGFLFNRQNLVFQVVIPHQERILRDEIPGMEPSHAIQNFKIAAGLEKGTFHGMLFQDSDVAKWLESVAYRLMVAPDPALEGRADEVISIIKKAQQPDGYVNTYFTLVEPDKRWDNIEESHELYCAGHMLEAAIAYYEATGKDTLLDVMIRFVDLIDATFGPEPGKIKGYPGHEELELALIKLYELTGNEKYLRLASYFVLQRGQQPHFFDVEYKRRRGTTYWSVFKERNYAYSQSHRPVLEQKKAVGHAVRAMYLYCAMADLARITGHKELTETTKTLWRNVINSQMYVTGAIGSESHGESFTFEYDLPPDRAYAETCASVGLFLWASRMLRMDLKNEYADIMEKAFYNGILAGISLDGTAFFYVNPLEVWPAACKARKELEHVKTTRQRWFACACCPPNLARLMSSVGKYMYSFNKNCIAVHLYGASEVWVEELGIQLVQKTDYPWDGQILLMVNPETEWEGIISLRIPGWAPSYSLLVNEKVLPFEVQDGYAYLCQTWKKGDKIRLNLRMDVAPIYSHPELRYTVGKVALARGPLIYCLEEIDNGPNLWALSIDTHNSFELYNSVIQGEPFIGIQTGGKRFVCSQENVPLYSFTKPQEEPTMLRFIPYYLWNNRGEGEMLVWVRQCFG